MSVQALLDPRLAPLAGATPEATSARVESLTSVLLLTRSRTTETAVVDVPSVGRVIRKRWWWPRSSDRVKGAFRTTVGAASPARREHAALTRLRALPGGAFAPEPLGVIEVRRAGVLTACTLLLEEIRGAVEFAAFLRDERDAAVRARVLGDLATRTRAMHAAGLLDREHHPRNVLVAGGRTWKVDCAKQRVRRGPVPPRAAIEDLATLDVALVRLASPAERESFLAAALGVPMNPALRVQLESRRARIDARESDRLPPLSSTSLPTDNDR